jgi:5-methylthioadenosine/S-adenosylhomocysteine deaminase
MHIDLLVHGPHVLTLAGGGVGYRSDTALAVDRGRILAVGPRDDILPAYTAERTIDADGHVILPGLIDGHMHTGMALLRGLAQDTSRWMMHGVGPFTPHLDTQAMDAGSRLAIVEALRSGTTTFGDFGWQMRGVCEFLERIGARGVVCTTIREAEQRIYAPGELYTLDSRLGRRQLEANLELFDRWNGAANGRIRVLFGPQGPDFVGRDLLLEIQRLARQRRTRIHMHTAQGDRETEQMLLRYGQRSIAWLESLGYLDPTLQAIHLTDASDAEAALVASRGCTMVLCSGSIGLIDGIVPPARAFQNAGGSVALGSDQAPGNNCHNIFNEMKLTALLNKVRAQDPEIMPAWRVLRMATIEGARAIGMADEIGSLEDGKRADVILVDLRRPSMLPVHLQPMRNLVPNLVYSARGDEVSTVVVDGEVVLDNGRVQRIDEAEVLRESQRLAMPVGAAAAEDFWRVDGASAHMMRDGYL